MNDLELPLIIGRPLTDEEREYVRNPFQKNKIVEEIIEDYIKRKENDEYTSTNF